MKRTTTNRLILFSIIGLILIIDSYGQKRLESTDLKEQITQNEKSEYSGGTQLEMNISSLNEFEHYDSILQNRIDRLTKILDRNLLIESQYTDSVEYIETKNFKEAIILSQESWVELRNMNSQVIELKYRGGSMKNMARNLQMTADTKDRIEFIEKLIYDETE